MVGATSDEGILVPSGTQDGRRSGHHCRKYVSHSIPISTKIRLMKALMLPVATYGCESWTLRKNEETRLDTFEMKVQCTEKDSAGFVDSKENK